MEAGEEKILQVESKDKKNRLWTANYILVCLASLALFFAFNGLIPTLPIYMERYGEITGAAGLPLAALTIGAVLTRPLTGWVLDVYGRKTIFWVGLLLFLLPTFVFIWMLPAPILIVFRFIQGIGWGICNTAMNTVAADNIPDKRMGEGMGFFTLTMSFTQAAAPAFGLWVMDKYSFPTLFLLLALITSISLVIALIIKYPEFKKKVEKPKFIFMDKLLLRPAVVMLLFCLSLSSVLSFLAVYAVMQGVSATGLFFTFFALSSIIFRPVCGRILDKRREKGYDLVVILGVVAQIIAMLILSRTSSVEHLIIGGAFFGLGFSSIQLAMLSLSLRLMPPEKRGVANATYWTAFDIGVAAGSIMWGIVAAAAGYYIMFNLNIVPIIAAMLVYFAKRLD